MRVILYMEMTINGLIAKKHDEIDWVSTEAWKSYSKTMEQMDAIIIGKRTYELMPKDEFFAKPLYIVVSNEKPKKKRMDNILFTNKTPQQIISDLKEYKNICVSGGSHINSLFMKNGLIDEMYVDLEPIIFGQGISLFNPTEFMFKLQLLNTKNLNKNTIQLHYKVVK